MPAPARSKGKIGVLIEDHFDEIEYREFNQYSRNEVTRSSISRTCGVRSSATPTAASLLLFSREHSSMLLSIWIGRATR